MRHYYWSMKMKMLLNVLKLIEESTTDRAAAMIATAAIEEYEADTPIRYIKDKERDEPTQISNCS